MRKYLLILFLSFIAIPILAQKGSTLLYGTLNYHKSDMSVGGSNFFSISPGLGYGLSEKWTAGLKLTYAHVDASYNSNTYGAGPFVRYTQPLSQIFSVFGQFETEYSVQRVTSQSNYNILRFAMIPAVEMNIKNGFALNFSFGGIEYAIHSGDAVTGHPASFSFVFGSSAGFGVSKRFGRKND